MSFSTVFKNFGHAIASGAKYFEKAAVQAISVTSKIEKVEPIAEGIIGVLAGPGALKISDLAFHILGDVATSLQNINQDGLQVVAEKGLMINTDLATLQDVKTAIDTIKNLLAAQGATIQAPAGSYNVGPAVPVTTALPTPVSLP